MLHIKNNPAVASRHLADRGSENKSLTQEPLAMTQSRAHSARPFAQALERLRAAGLRPTRQRLALAKILFEKGDRHVSAELLRDEAGNHGVRVSLATIYNTLHQFTAAGLMREIVVDGQRAYFDTNTTDHHHFFYEGSGRLQDIPADGVKLARVPEPPRGARVRRVEVIVRVEGD